MASPDSLTALDYIESQTQLEEEAKELMPYDPQHCTFHDGSIRQQLFVCATCMKKNKGQCNAVCYSCSIQCHSDHDLVELFTKRGFACDCGTERMRSFGGCNLRKNFDALDIPERTNKYGHNFEGRFCSCDEPYDPTKERGVMFQCLFGDACNEDWYHEECIINVPRGSSKRPLKVKQDMPKGVNLLDAMEDAHSDSVQAPDEVPYDGDESEDELPTIDGLPRQSEVSAFICWLCIRKHQAVMRLIAGITDLAIRVDRPDRLDPFKIEVQPTTETDNEEPSRKKLKVEDEKPTAADLSDSSKASVSDDFSLFLKDGFQEKLSKRTEPSIVKLLENFPFFAEEEEIYEPPEDDDANSSLLDAGTRALNSLPREQAMNGLRAYEQIRQQLTSFLRPFAEEGKIVTEGDVNGFFEKFRDDQFKRLHESV